jgi:hypothetical protein
MRDFTPLATILFEINWIKTRPPGLPFMIQFIRREDNKIHWEVITQDNKATVSQVFCGLDTVRDYLSSFKYVNNEDELVYQYIQCLYLHCDELRFMKKLYKEIAWMLNRCKQEMLFVRPTADTMLDTFFKYCLRLYEVQSICHLILPTLSIRLEGHTINKFLKRNPQVKKLEFIGRLSDTHASFCHYRKFGKFTDEPYGKDRFRYCNSEEAYTCTFKDDHRLRSTVEKPVTFIWDCLQDIKLDELSIETSNLDRQALKGFIREGGNYCKIKELEIREEGDMIITGYSETHFGLWDEATTADVNTPLKLKKLTLEVSNWSESWIMTLTRILENQPNLQELRLNGDNTVRYGDDPNLVQSLVKTVQMMPRFQLTFPVYPEYPYNGFTDLIRTSAWINSDIFKKLMALLSVHWIPRLQLGNMKFPVDIVRRIASTLMDWPE